MPSGIGHLVDANTVALWRLDDAGTRCLQRPSAQYHVPNSVSWIERTFTFNSPGYLTYQYYVQGEVNYDYLQVLVNGNVIATHTGNPLSGTNSWNTSGGTVTVRFLFRKDGSADVGADTARIFSVFAHNVDMGGWTGDYSETFTDETLDPSWVRGGYGGGWELASVGGTFASLVGDMSLTGTATQVAATNGLVGSALEFKGGGLSCTASAALAAAALADWTVSFWFKRGTGQDGGYGGIFDVCGSGDKEVLGIYTQNYRLHVQWYAWPYVDSPVTFAAGTWYHCAVTCAVSGTSRVITMYVNGVQVTQGTIAGPNTYANLKAWMGVGHSGSNLLTDSAVDDLKVSNVVRTASEIYNDYLRPSAEDAGFAEMQAANWDSKLNHLHVRCNQRISPGSVETASLTWGGGAVLARSAAENILSLDVEVVDPAATYQLDVSGLQDLFGREAPAEQFTVEPQQFLDARNPSQSIAVPAVSQGRMPRTLTGGTTASSGESSETIVISGSRFNGGFN